MSESKHVVEGELVRAGSQPTSLSTQSDTDPPERPIVKALAMAGAVLAYAGSEIVPRVAATLLDAWDRHTDSSNAPLGVSDDSGSPRSLRHSGLRRTRTEGAQHRWRRGQGK